MIDLAERVAYWQRVLRLQDWDIHASYRTQADIVMVGGDAQATGWGNYSVDYRKSVIWLRDPSETPALDPSDVPFADAFPYDVEQTLLHELMHLVVHQGMSKDGVEFAVELLADAFVRCGGTLPAPRRTEGKGACPACGNEHVGADGCWTCECPKPPAPRRACMVPAPDQSGRTCDKPEGHDGDHWTYGGHELTWPPAPRRTEVG